MWTMHKIITHAGFDSNISSEVYCTFRITQVWISSDAILVWSTQLTVINEAATHRLNEEIYVCDGSFIINVCVCIRVCSIIIAVHTLQASMNISVWHEKLALSIRDMRPLTTGSTTLRSNTTYDFLLNLILAADGPTVTKNIHISLWSVRCRENNKIQHSLLCARTILHEHPPLLWLFLIMVMYEDHESQNMYCVYPNSGFQDSQSWVSSRWRKGLLFRQATLFNPAQFTSTRINVRNWLF